MQEPGSAGTADVSATRHPRAPRLGRGAGLAIAVAAVVPFALVADLGFMGDDYGRIGLAIEHAREPWRWIWNLFFGLRPAPEYGAQFFRPLYELSFLLDLAVFGARPIGFLLSNLVLHALTALCVAGIAARLWGDRRAAVLAGVLFAVFPTQVEPVAWIAARGAQMAVCFGCAAVLLACIAREHRGPRRVAASAGSALATLLALLSKEQAVVIPGVVALVAAALAFSAGQRAPRALTGEALRASGPGLLVLAVYAVWRIRVLGGFGSYFAFAPPDPTGATYWLTRFGFLRLLFAPLRGDVFGALASVGFAALSLAAVLLAVRRPRGRIVLALAAGWILVGMAPMHWVDVDPQTLLESRHLQALTVPWALLLGGLAGASGARRLHGTLAVVLPVSFLALLTHNLLIYREANAVGERLRAEITRVALQPRKNPTEQRSLEDVPFEHRGAPIGSALEHLLAEHWLGASPAVPTRVYSTWDMLGVMADHVFESEVGPGSWRRFTWNRQTLTLDEQPRERPFAILRGRVAAGGIDCVTDPVTGGADRLLDHEGRLVEMRYRQDPAGGLTVLEARPVEPMLEVEGPLHPGATLTISVRARPRAQVVILRPGGPGLLPIRESGTVLVEPVEMLVFGFADASGRFVHRWTLPDSPDIAGVQLRLQAVAGTMDGWTSISECVCDTVEPR